MDIYSLPEPLRQLVADELSSGERVRWAGRPIPRYTFSWVALLPVFFGVPWTLFALFWMAGASGVLQNGFKGFGQLDTEGLVFSLFGIPFVLIGLAMLSIPYWIRRRMGRAAARTAYVITDRRAIIFDGGYYGDRGLASLLGPLVLGLTGKGVNICSYAPHKLRQVQRVQREDGSGDVIFGEVLLTSETSGQDEEITRTGFFSIPEVKEVEELLKSLAESGRKAEA